MQDPYPDVETTKSAKHVEKSAFSSNQNISQLTSLWSLRCLCVDDTNWGNAELHMLPASRRLICKVTSHALCFAMSPMTRSDFCHSLICWKENKKTARHLCVRLCLALYALQYVSMNVNLHLQLQSHYITLYYITVQCNTYIVALNIFTPAVKGCEKHSTWPCLVPRPNWSKPSSLLESFRPHVTGYKWVPSAATSDNQHMFTKSHSDNTDTSVLLWG